MKMNIRRNLITILTLAFAASTASFTLGQGPPTPPSPAQRAQHEVKYLTTLLSLNSTQQQQASTIYTNSATAEESARQSMKSAHDNLRAAIKNNDAAAIDQASNALAQEIAQSTSTKAKADAAFYQILTPEQQSKMSELESERPGPFFPGGGPVGFPGGDR
jgi:Spy/CpxP family protein refolding chaperone